MNIVITATDNKKSAPFDLRFGRAQWFCLYNDETGKTEFHENKYINDGHGAGQKAAELMGDLKVEKVISGDFGPKAKDLLEKLKIQMVIITNDNHTIKDIINQLSTNN
jgi:predicted Fe-Mo cluster-binding NifX family protein